MNPTRDENNGNREVLVDKLQGALNVLRRERDEINRKKDIAAERLRLLKEECTNAEKSFAVLRDDYDKMIADSNRENETVDIEKLEMEVQRLGREAKFQHAELIGKREKMNHLKDRHDKENKARLFQLRNSKEHLRMALENLAVRQSKERNHSKASQDLDIDAIRRLIVNRIGDAEFFSSVKRLILVKVEEEKIAIESLKSDVDTLQRQHSGYAAYLSSKNIISGL